MNITDYILNNYRKLATSEELKLLTKFSDVYFFYNNSALIAAKSPEWRMKRYSLSQQDLEYYDEQKIAEIRESIAKRILSDHNENIVLNYCPKCGELARTPVANQAPCGHRW